MISASDVLRPSIPIEDFLDHTTKGRFEYINGEWIEKMGTILLHAYLIRKILFIFMELEKQGPGEVFPETTFIPEEKPRWVKGSRIPDLMFYTTECVRRLTESPQWEAFPSTVVPNIVLEVVSPADEYDTVVEKAQRYLTDGVEMVWLVSPKTRRVTIFVQGQADSIYLEGDTVLTGGAVLPEFSVSLSELFSIPVIRL